MGKFLQVGEFLMSSNGRFCGQLQQNGTFGVYWNQTDAVLDPPPKEFQPGGEPIWITDRSGPDGDYFLVMQSDGNLVIYPGTNFQNCGHFLWNNDRPDQNGTLALNLQDNGCLMVTRNGAQNWSSGTDVMDDWPLTAIISKARIDGPTKWDHTVLALSTRAATNGGAGLQAAPEPQTGLSVTGLSNDGKFTATPDQIWRRLYWYQDGAFIGCVMVSQARRMALSWDGELTTTLTNEITPASTWTFGEKESDGEWRAIRPFQNDTVNLNVKGNPPYATGTEVILWRWNKGGADNLIWEFFGNYDPPGPRPPH
jgi:hypothetical protein